jgi:hypothetical protein
MHSSHTGIQPPIFPGLASGLLLFIGQLCDDAEPFSAGTARCQPNFVPPTPSYQSINSIADRIAFIHAAMFSSALSTWCAAIKAGQLTTFPDLTSN